MFNAQLDMGRDFLFFDGVAQQKLQLICLIPIQTYSLWYSWNLFSYTS